MTPRTSQPNPTAGALRETLEILESIIEQAGDLIESRSPELVAEARAALKRYSEEAPNASSE